MPAVWDSLDYSKSLIKENNAVQKTKLPIQTIFSWLITQYHQPDCSGLLHDSLSHRITNIWVFFIHNYTACFVVVFSRNMSILLVPVKTLCFYFWKLQAPVSFTQTSWFVFTAPQVLDLFHSWPHGCFHSWAHSSFISTSQHTCSFQNITVSSSVGHGQALYFALLQAPYSFL